MYFGEVYAVDISREMVRQAREAVAGFPNAHVIRNNGKDLSAVRTEMVGPIRTGPKAGVRFCIFGDRFPTHPQPEIIENYVREVSPHAAARGAL